MKTTIDIPDNVLREAMALTKAKTKREAVVRILEGHIRRARMAELVRYSGTFSDDFPTNDEIEAMDAPNPVQSAWRGEAQTQSQVPLNTRRAGTHR